MKTDNSLRLLKKYLDETSKAEVIALFEKVNGKSNRKPTITSNAFISEYNAIG